MIRRGNFIWEGLSAETKPTVSQGSGDFQYFKEMDTGETYECQSGIWINISAGLSFIRATKSGFVTTDGAGIGVVVFNTPLISGLYTVTLTCQDQGAGNPVVATFSNVTQSGFSIHTRKTPSGQPAPNIFVSWLATRDYNP